MAPQVLGVPFPHPTLSGFSTHKLAHTALSLLFMCLFCPGRSVCFSPPPPPATAWDLCPFLLRAKEVPSICPRCCSSITDRAKSTEICWTEIGDRLKCTVPDSRLQKAFWVSHNQLKFMVVALCFHSLKFTVLKWGCGFTGKCNTGCDLICNLHYVWNSSQCSQTGCGLIW